MYELHYAYLYMKFTCSFILNHLGIFNSNLWALIPTRNEVRQQLEEQQQQQHQQQYASLSKSKWKSKSLPCDFAACPTLHAVRDSCSAIKVKFVNLQFSSKRRLLVDWTHLFSAHNSAEFNRVTVTLTLVCRLGDWETGQRGDCTALLWPGEAVAPLAFLNWFPAISISWKLQLFFLFCFLF